MGRPSSCWLSRDSGHFVVGKQFQIIYSNYWTGLFKAIILCDQYRLSLPASIRAGVWAAHPAAVVYKLTPRQDVKNDVGQTDICLP
jgi:hypothetical protein